MTYLDEFMAGLKFKSVTVVMIDGKRYIRVCTSNEKPQDIEFSDQQAFVLARDILATIPNRAVKT